MQYSVWWRFRPEFLDGTSPPPIKFANSRWFTWNLWSRWTTWNSNLQGWVGVEQDSVMTLARGPGWNLPFPSSSDQICWLVASYLFPPTLASSPLTLVIWDDYQLWLFAFCQNWHQNRQVLISLLIEPLDLVNTVYNFRTFWTFWAFSTIFPFKTIF